MTVGLAAAGGRLVNEVPEQVRVAEMEAVEDADDDEDRAEIGLERLDALDDEHRRCQATGAAGAGAAGGATKTLSGASRPPAAVAIATSEPPWLPEPVVVRRAGQAARRADELASRDGHDLLGGQGHDREDVEPGVDRSEERDETVGAVGGGRADGVE